MGKETKKACDKNRKPLICLARQEGFEPSTYRFVGYGYILSPSFRYFLCSYKNSKLSAIAFLDVSSFFRYFRLRCWEWCWEEVGGKSYDSKPTEYIEACWDVLGKII